jgi:hypothetical protein
MPNYSRLLLLAFLPVTLFAQNPGDTLFGSSFIHNINIAFSQASWWDSLMYYKQHADSFNLSTQAMMGDVTIDGTLIDSVGVQLKGNSSFGYPGQKKPIKITFNEYINGRKLEGLTALNLNNNAIDPTMMREKLLLDFLNKKALPAPRCTYANVFYNGQYAGLYKMVEPVDKAFITARIGSWGGNLFKGDPQGTLNWSGSAPSAYYPYYELHSNKTLNDWTDLVTLIDRINNTPTADFYDTLENRLNTTPLIGQWAARNLFVDLDAYFHAPHNYYLYHNTVSGKFEWCTWDVSVAFGFYPYWKEDSTAGISLLMADHPLAARMVSEPAYKTTYLNTVCDYLSYFDTTVLGPIIDSIANRIYPSFAAEPDSNQMFPEQILYFTLDTMTIQTPVGDIPALKKFISKRRAKVLAELNALGWTCPLISVAEKRRRAEISVYPNPFWTSATIETDEPMHNATLSIYNTWGQLVKRLTNISGRQYSLERDGLPPGIYLLKVREGNKAVAQVKVLVTDY